jgi:hypothetical protein
MTSGRRGLSGRPSPPLKERDEKVTHESTTPWGATNPMADRRYPNEMTDGIRHGNCWVNDRISQGKAAVVRRVLMASKRKS